MDVKLRKISVTDIEKIRNWRNSDLIKNVSFNRSFISTEMQKKWFENVKLMDSQLHWIITVDGVDAGYAAVKNIDLDNERCEFASLYIGEEQFLLNGIGALSEYKVIDYLYSTYPKINKIYCEVLDFNKKVIQLHKKFGFVIEGELKQHYFINGQFNNVILLALFKNNWNETKVFLSKILKT
jgi:RimJ/RimL family protein N-acetyltransferase